MVYCFGNSSSQGYPNFPFEYTNTISRRVLVVGMQGMCLDKVYQILLNDFVLIKLTWQKPTRQWIATVCWLRSSFLTFRLSFLLLVHLVFLDNLMYETNIKTNTWQQQGHQYTKVQYKWATLASVWRHSTQYLETGNFDSTTLGLADYLPTVKRGFFFNPQKEYQFY